MLDPSFSIKLLDDLIKRNRGRKRILLLEIRDNIKTIELLDNNVHIDMIINELEFNKLEEALNSNFDFRSYSILRHKVNKKTARNNPLYEKYAGQNTEDVFKTIYLDIKSLKRVVGLNPQPENIDKKILLMEIYSAMNLLLFHLNKKRTRNIRKK